MRLLVSTLFLIFGFSSFATITSAFSSNVAKGCSPLQVNLTDHSVGSITARRWDFGNGNTSTLTNPSVQYNTPGTYVIRQYVSYGTNVDSSSQVIVVFSPPTVGFTSDITAACPQQAIQFTDQSIAGQAPINHLAWDFGNGIANSDNNISYSYPVSGTYNVTLVAQDTNGCASHLTKTAYITIWPKPTATYTASPLVSCAASQVVNFTNQSTGNGLSNKWNFGDGAFCNTVNPSHLYAQGKYKATLIVTNSDGCIDSIKQNVQVINLKANFAATDTNVCTGAAIIFNELSPMPGANWHWDFGDSTSTNNRNPTKSYSQPGIYSVTFKLTDNICGDVSTKVKYINVYSCIIPSITSSAGHSCTAPFLVRFYSQAPTGSTVLWHFGDGDSSTAFNPTHTYLRVGLFTVSLTITDSNGISATTVKPNYINISLPYVNFESDTLFCPGHPVQFTNLSSSTTRFLWHFGDGDTSVLYNPVHVYRSYGHYGVSLTAWDSSGCDATNAKLSYIHIDSLNIGFNVSDKFSMCPPLASVFSSYSNRAHMTYKWVFGDGYTDTAVNPTHVYFHPGLYTVELIGTSTYGCSYTIVDSNLILVQGPTGTFADSTVSGCVPLNVSFTGSTSLNTQSVSCDLGNGIVNNGLLNFNYTYTTANTFHPSFILRDNNGCSVSYPLDSIISYPLPTLNVKDTSICRGSVVNIATDHYQSQWSQASGSVCDTCFSVLSLCDTCGSVVLGPLDTTSYRVKTTNQYGCSVSTTFKMNVVPMPVLKPQDTIKICKNASVQIDVVENASHVTWTPSTYLTRNSASPPVSTPAEDITYLVTASNQIGCSVSENVIIKVYETIPVSVNADTAVCPGSLVQLNASVNDTFFHDVTYTWGNSSNLSANNIADPMATIGSGAETFTVTATSGACPATSASMTVGVNPAANVILPATIVTTPNTEISISPVSGDLTTYNWSAKDQPSCIDCASMTLVPAESQVVYLNGGNQYGCKATDSMMIHIVSCDPASIFVPNTFTPNGDGTNDILYVRSKALAEMEYFQIFNRWGAIVFQTNNMTTGWDGLVNGKMAEEGTYVYQIKGKCQDGYDVSTNGAVTLLR